MQLESAVHVPREHRLEALESVAASYLTGSFCQFLTAGGEWGKCGPTGHPSGSKLGQPPLGRDAGVYPQMIPAKQAARLACALGDACVGGMALYGLCLQAKRFSLASSILLPHYIYHT